MSTVPKYPKAFFLLACMVTWNQNTDSLVPFDVEILILQTGTPKYLLTENQTDFFSKLFFNVVIHLQVKDAGGMAKQSSGQTAHIQAYQKNNESYKKKCSLRDQSLPL